MGKHTINFAKAWARIKLMGLSGIYKLVSQFFNLLLSLAVIRLHSETLWGAYVQYLLIIQLASQILSWGSGDYLLREFSKNPQHLKRTWQIACTSRSIILLPVLTSIFFIDFDTEGRILLALWIVLDFLYGLFNSVVIYLRKYQTATYIEVSGHLIVLIPVVLKNHLTEHYFISLLLFSLVVKSISQIIVFRQILFGNWHFQIDWAFLKKSFSFLLVSLIGLAQSKVDIYIVALILEKPDLASYQVLMRWLSVGHLGLTFALLPFIQNFYRLKRSAITKITLKVMLGGLAVSLIQLIGLFFVFQYFYQFDFPWAYYAIMLLYLMPFYSYYLKIYEFFKRGKQTLISILFILIGIANVIVSLLLIPNFGTLGALITATLMQYLLLIGFYTIESIHDRFTIY